MEQFQIIHKSTKEEAFIVINKASGLPSAPLNLQDSNNALMLLAKDFPEILQVKGRKPIEYGLLHRIDTVTKGLLLIATSQDCYDFINNEQELGNFEKEYTAICTLEKDNGENLQAFPPSSISNEDFRAFLTGKKELCIKSYFRSYGKGSKEVRPVTEQSGKAALKKIGKLTEYETLVRVNEINGSKIIVKCKIKKGFRHQVRCHLAWLGLPIINDPLYNYKSKDCKENTIEFSATSLKFQFPAGKINVFNI